MDKILSSNLQRSPVEEHFQTYSGWLQSAGLKVVGKHGVWQISTQYMGELSNDLLKN